MSEHAYGISFVSPQSADYPGISLLSLSVIRVDPDEYLFQESTDHDADEKIRTKRNKVVGDGVDPGV